MSLCFASFNYVTPTCTRYMYIHQMNLALNMQFSKHLKIKPMIYLRCGNIAHPMGTMTTRL